MKPQKRILSREDLDIWTQSSQHAALLSFVQDLQDSVFGVANDAKVAVSAPVASIAAAIDRVDQIIDANPVVRDKNVSRFGKPEFRGFYDQVSAEAPSLMAAVAPDHAEELGCYFAESWGDRTRIDYGSGHELNLLCLFYCLKEIGVLKPSDYQALIIVVFNKYMAVMRRLQKTYWLEPAGSHGVWGLDDYHFLPFLFGSAQLAPHPHMKPKSVHNRELVETYWRQYMYLECIHFINSIKTVPGHEEASLRWHSPMLDDISAAKTWGKIRDGMVKMYAAEVLAKLPIVQHMMFGSILTAPEGVGQHAPEPGCSHNTWGDCCGIKVPSAVAASMSRPMPFD
ncbi:Phosphotyrosyl phosphate activator (PTPA) family protein [Clavispora lusitaniae]|uniref:Serine/threonine-protein phosphatase 2A activator n=1 Tax=Clavispora lusitaniae (strain ATCC 42720) TaxID=306902 RepID=C4Y333_CLAL4|nr:uncharacterized protein CLUG_02946 [Clavispora lusitaniae ATCC 42720]EEQ38821.1 hypothetical protein CLUG_02946 [Clavispora lusitaniae ATCC 42720]KAF7579818.1 Phosphotyrosyl phosphate activator (PTPA) family protein [Clavispora lusitaniae]